MTETEKKYIAHQEICDEIHQLYVRKNNDYGFAIEKGIEEMGWSYISAQLYNKTLRFINLTKPETVQKVSDESLEDTLTDLANYSIEAMRVGKSGAVKIPTEALKVLANLAADAVEIVRIMRMNKESI